MKIEMEFEDLEKVIKDTLMDYNVKNYCNPEGINLKLPDLLADENVKQGRLEVGFIAKKLVDELILKSMDNVHKEDDVIVLNLCEQYGLILKPDVLYRFEVDKTCKSCKRLEKISNGK